MIIWPDSCCLIHFLLVIYHSIVQVGDTLGSKLVRSYKRYKNPSEKRVVQCCNYIAHTIHVWYIYLHLVDAYGTCRCIYIYIYIPYMDPMGR